MGTPETAVPTLQRCLEDGHDIVAVWTQPDRPSGRGHKLAAPPVKKFASAHGLTVHQPAKIKTEEARALFESHGADAAIVVAYGRILPAAFLRAPRRGCINVHLSLLPKYRGAAPANWAIVRGERETGVTTMLIDEGLDTGAILLQRATEIGERETAPELMSRLAPLGAQVLSETLARLDEIEPRAQAEWAATDAPILRREDGRIDWTMEAGAIERRVRGFQPWPGAYTEYGGRRLVVWQSDAAHTEASPAEPRQSVEAGEIIEARGDNLSVACGGETMLRLLEVQLEGKRRMSARDLLNGVRLRAGERFGKAVV